MGPMDPDDDKTKTFVPLTNGTMVSHYRIIDKIGAGGMGEVYRAEDTNLSRQVAIKVLPDLFGGDAERLARFEREAKLLASLNHPNLATVYGFESVEAKRFLVMEMVEGETLAERIAKGPLPLDDALDVFRQIASGMEAAHEKGIIHRDLKPANVKITPEGKVKILDFGLAKVLHGETVASDLANSPTITENMTRAGVILGTVAYMSPEQAKGKSVDKRTDIWAFGCILFECLAGKRAFEGETTSETLAAILRGEPDWQKLPVQTPPHIRAQLQRCLQKEVSRRLRDIGDAVLDDWEAAEIPSNNFKKVRGKSWGIIIPWASVAFLVVLVGCLLFMGKENRPTNDEPIVSYIPPPDNSIECFTDGFALSPDGRKLAFVSLSSNGERQVWLRYLDRRDALPLAGTQDACYPFWSPDSKQLAFYAGGYLKRIAIDGGPNQSLCRAGLNGRWGGSWGSAGVILFHDVFEGISHVSEAGGEPVRVLLDGALAFPSFLPDGQHFLYIGWEEGETKVFVSSITRKDSAREIRGTSDVGRVALVTPDWLLIWRRSDRSLFSQRVDLKSDTVLGPPMLLSESVPSPGDWPMFSASGTDVAAFVMYPLGAANSSASRMDWIDRQGNIVGALGKIGSYWNLRISPDGHRVAVNYDDDVWLVDAATGLLTRLTYEVNSGGYAYRPIWSPKGDRVLARKGGNELTEYQVPVGKSRSIWRDTTSYWNATDWSSDEYYIAVSRNVGAGNLRDLDYFDVSNDVLKSFLTTTFDECGGEFSPDDRWMAYSSNESGSYEIYVRSFPDGSQMRRISYSGGMHPRWRADGKELFFLGPGGVLMAADVRLQPTLEIGSPKQLFQVVMADIVRGQIAPYDVSPDGQRFLVIVPQRKPLSITLVQNWQALVDRK